MPHSKFFYIEEIKMDRHITSKLRFFYILFITLITPLFADEKLLIFTYSYNRPDFIEIQQKTFNKFLQDDYTFVVFNDAVDPIIALEIQQKCKELGIKCIDIPQHIHKSHNPSDRNGAVVDFSLDKLGYQHNGMVILLDSDLFLVKEFSIVNYMQDFPLSGVAQARTDGEIVIDYLWVGIVFIDMSKLPNKESLRFSPGNIRGINVDTGGFSHFYLSQNRSVPIKYMNMSYVSQAHRDLTDATCLEYHQTQEFPCSHIVEKIKEQNKFDDKQIKYILDGGSTNSEFYLNAHFFHYRCGSNWDGQSREYHLRKTQFFNQYINAILNE